ncbi:upstream stimulatory factor 2 isoform X3 [Paramormyrops kingsleyae]|uniref:upstream stimulatory factor 2 isoform X3 n=1 Tax=Paramormyrops kingsleyae TaxID=1676925 RepID=UPI000CD6096F|nr:upstream stimulatory factor 2-like isoform X3 [Paramormyrops kingsleyae]
MQAARPTPLHILSQAKFCTETCRRLADALAQTICRVDAKIDRIKPRHFKEEKKINESLVLSPHLSDEPGIHQELALRSERGRERQEAEDLMDMLEQTLDTVPSHENQESEEVVQLQEEESLGGEEPDSVTIETVQQGAVTIETVQQAAAFSDHNVQYQFRTENSGGQAVAQNTFSNGGSPAAESAGGETRFTYFPAAAVSDGSALSIQTDQAATQAGSQFYVMMTPSDVLQSNTPRTIAPRTHPYSTKLEGPRAPRDERRRAQHNEVERRRRDKINNWIVTLSKIIPDCNVDSTKTGASKGGILSKACDYIRELRQDHQQLQEGCKEVERLQVENEVLRQQIEELKNENALLRAQLQQHGIDGVGDMAAH